MNTHRTHWILALLLCLTLWLMTACGDTPDTPPEADVPTVTVFSPGSAEYAFVFQATGSDAIDRCLNLLSQIPDTKPTIHNDRWDEVEKEILIGRADREVIPPLAEEMDKLATEDAFHFLVAEEGGKIVLLADHDIGYQYLTDYLPDTYMKDGVLAIPIGLRDMQTVTWEEYHASAYYAEVLKKEEERVQREKEKEAEALRKKEEELNQLRTKVKEFNTADFGTRDAFPMGKYGTPPVYPAKSHPRILFTENTIDTVRANLTNEENAAAYKAYITNSDSYTTGILPPVKDASTHNMNYDVAAAIEAKAFRYAMTGDEYYGYQAVYAIKNMLLTLDIPKGSLGDACRAWGYVMYIAGCVYDWCYDLLTDECKEQIINGCVALMGPEMEIGVPPSKQGTVYGHGGEAQILRDWLCIAIACADEAPDIYDFVAGRILSDYVEAIDYLQQSENHWEGSMYGPYRYHFQLYSHLLFDRMTDGTFAAFSDNMLGVARTFIHYVRPDAQPLRIGDMWGQTGTTFNISHYGNVAFLAGNYFKDPELRSFAYENLNKFSRFTMSNNALTPVMVLTLNDPTVGMKDHEAVPVSRVTKDPLVSVFARTTWDREDEEAAMVYMTMPRSYAPSHAHMDCGSFQIYYKGILASDGGTYSSWGDHHHFGYTMQTVSANSILVYNPNMVNSTEQAGKHTAFYSGFVYSGGQSNWAERMELPTTLPKMLQRAGQFQCTTLGAVTAETDGRYDYAYLGGDMTAAYDKETVDEVTRYMFSATTEDKDRPLVLVTFDRITADDASYRKSAIIHCEEEPTVTEDGFVIVENTKRNNSGKLIIQSVMTDTEFTLIGGEGKRYWLHDTNADTKDDVQANAVAEYGWGRIEISPAQASKTDYLLTVMYVTDAKNTDAPLKATDISSENLAGAQLLGQAMLFPKTEKLLSSSSTFTLDEGGACTISGIAAGQWTIQNGQETKTIEVKDGENLLTFTAVPGTIMLTPAN